MDSVFPPVTVGSDGSIRAKVFVKNSGRAVKALPVALFRSASGKELKPSEIESPPPVDIPAGVSAFALPLSMPLPKLEPSDFPLNGWLILRDSQNPDKALTSKAMEIKGVLGPSTGADRNLLKYALMFAVTGIALAGFISMLNGNGFKVLFHRMGKPEWKFESSWSSTITIVGSAVIPILTNYGAPEQGGILSKKSYLIVSLMLGALVLLAPGIYGLFSRTVQAKDNFGASVVESQGYVLLFLAAALFTMTGVLAQLGLLRLLFNDVAAAGVLSPSTARFWCDLLRGLQAILLIHAVASIVQTIRAQSLPTADAEGTQPRQIQRAGVQLNAATVGNVKPQLPGWSLL